MPRGSVALLVLAVGAISFGLGATLDLANLRSRGKKKGGKMDPDSEKNMKAFPEPEPGQVRYVLHMPKVEDESLMKVELIVGKTVETDGHNRHFFTGTLEEESIKGWGFTRYVLKDLGVMAGTLMAVHPSQPPVKTLVRVGGEPKLLRYNSRLAIVVYVPEGVEVRSRFWSGPDETKPVPRG